MTDVLIRSAQRHSAIGVTERKRSELCRLAQICTAARRAFTNEYWAPRYAADVMWNSRGLREARRNEGRLKWPGLTTHQTEMTLADTLAALKARWAAVLARVRARIRMDPGLTTVERHWCFLVLRRPDLLGAICQRHIAAVDADWAAGLDQRVLSVQLRRLILRSRGGQPHAPRTAYFVASTNMYRTFRRPEDRYFRGAWIAITGTQPGKRVCIPLAGADFEHLEPRTEKANSRPMLRVEVGRRIVFHTVDRLPRPPRRVGRTVGVDLGYRTLITASAGDPDSAESFGEFASDSISSIADGAADRQKRRNALKAYERSLRAALPARAKRIRQHNLGSKRLSHLARADRIRLTQQVNLALNSMLRPENGIAKIVHEQLRFFGRRFPSRAMNRRIARWLHGYARTRLCYKAELNGVELQAVSAAYTSQTCPHCGFTSRANRRGERFMCTSPDGCRYTGSADAVAATNVLRRGSDPAITVFMRHGQVKRILEERWRSARSGSARGSNEGLPQLGRSEDLNSDRAANGVT